MTMAWVGIGSAVVGAAGQYMAADKARKAANGAAPSALPGPASPGSTMTNYGASWWDPVTQQMTQYTNNFDPSQLQAQWDAQSMYDAFMGTSGTSGMMSNVDWQLRQLQQKYDQMSKAGTRSQTTLPSEYQGIQPYLDDQGNLADWARDPDGIKQGRYGEKGQKIYDEFMRSTGGSYGSGGFNAWLKDNVNRNVVPQAEQFAKYKQTNMGNQDANTSALSDLKNQIDYLTEYKGRLSGQPSGQNALSNNPLMKYLNDIGGTWQGGDNANPYLGSWEEVMQRKLEGDKNASPDAIYKQYGLTGADGTDPQAMFQSKMEGLLGGLGNYDRVTAPTLDNGGGGRMGNALNFRSQQNFANQKAARDAQMARRGMLSSAVNELAGAQDSLNLGAQLNENALAASNYFNDNVTKQFGMEAQAAGQNNAAELARRGLQLQYTNDLNTTGFNQNMAKAGFAETVKNNLFQQALAALGQNNAMRQQERDWKTQDYTYGRQENADLYARQQNMYNLLNQQRQQAFGNNLQTNQAALQGTQALMPYNMQMVGMQNDANVGNAQMNNAWNMNQAQSDASRWMAMGQGIGNIASAGMNAYGNYLGSQKQPSTTGSGSPGGWGSSQISNWGSGGGSTTPQYTFNSDWRKS